MHCEICKEDYCLNCSKQRETEEKPEPEDPNRVKENSKDYPSTTKYTEVHRGGGNKYQWSKTEVKPELVSDDDYSDEDDKGKGK